MECPEQSGVKMVLRKGHGCGWSWRRVQHGSLCSLGKHEAELMKEFRMFERRCRRWTDGYGLLSIHEDLLFDVATWTSSLVRVTCEYPFL